MHLLTCCTHFHFNSPCLSLPPLPLWPPHTPLPLPLGIPSALQLPLHSSVPASLLPSNPLHSTVSANPSNLHQLFPILDEDCPVWPFTNCLAKAQARCTRSAVGRRRWQRSAEAKECRVDKRKVMRKHRQVRGVKVYPAFINIVGVPSATAVELDLYLWNSLISDTAF